MAYDIPLPAAPERLSILDAFMKAQNAGNDITKNRFNNQILGAEAKYAEPNAQAKNALAQLLPQEQQLKNQMLGIETQNLPDKLKAALLQQQLQNKISGVTAKYAEPNALADLSKTQLGNKEAGFKNKLLEAEIPFASQIAQNKAMSNSGLGVGGKEQMFFNNLVAKDNPKIANDPDKLYEAQNAIANGQTHLADGTPLKVSAGTTQSLNRITKYGSTAYAINRGLGAAGAEAEIDNMEKAIDPYLKEYGDTYAGYSPKQIVDSFKKDDASQTRLGNFVAAQGAQYEISQMRIRIAQGEPGVQATQELMNRSGQLINQWYPEMSSKAREVARKRLDKILKDALAARQKVGINPSTLTKLANEPGQQQNVAPSENDPLGWGL